MSPDSAKGYWCAMCKAFIAPSDWVAHLLSEEGTREAVMVRTIRDLIEAGDDIRCYPSGAVGFEGWNDSMETAELVLGVFLDEDGNWHPMEPQSTVQPT